MAARDPRDYIDVSRLRRSGSSDGLTFNRFAPGHPGGLRDRSRRRKAEMAGRAGPSKTEVHSWPKPPPLSGAAERQTVGRRRRLAK